MKEPAKFDFFLLTLGGKEVFVSLKKVSDPLQCTTLIPISDKDPSLKDTREHQMFIRLIGLILFYDDYRAEVLIRCSVG